VAHKTGQITATLHDAAIVYPEGRAPFVLVVLTRGIPDVRVAERLTADIAAIAWEWLGTR
jgi:beta-lactamase class A